MIKKVLTVIIIILLMSVAVIYFYYKEKSYEYEYKIDEFTIVEKYDVDKSYYIYNIEGKETYKFNINENYIPGKKHITKITESNNCLEIKGSLEFYVICKTDEELTYSFNYVMKNQKHEDSFDNIKIYDTNSYSFLLWNYKNFIRINDEDIEEINIFEDDIYNPSLIVNLGQKLFIPNYDEEYYFSSYYTIDFKSGDINEIKIASEINFDFAYTNYEDGILNIYDKKNNKEFIITIKNGEIKTKNQIEYSNNELESKYPNLNTSFYSIVNNNLQYKIGDYKIILDDINIDKIIYQQNNEVVFLSATKLYHFSLSKGITLLLENPEWEFNNENLIYISKN